MISGFTLDIVETLGEKKFLKDLSDAINAGARIIATTLQRFLTIREKGWMKSSRSMRLSARLMKNTRVSSWKATVS